MSKYVRSELWPPPVPKSKLLQSQDAQVHIHQIQTLSWEYRGQTLIIGGQPFHARARP